MKKNKVIGLLATLGCIAVGAGANMVHSAKVTAETADTVLATVAENFNMEYGASVRIGTNNGIRFTATLDETVYGNLEALESDTTVKVNYGMLIIPKDYTNVLANVKSVFNNDAYHLSNEQTCECGKTHIAAVEYETIDSEKLEHEKTDGVMYLRGSLVGIAQNNLTREFVGVGYIEYVVNDVPDYYFAAYAKDKGDDDGVDDIENNTRSMTYVAQLAIADEKDTDGTLQTNYLAPLAGNQYKYTVNHYLPSNVTWNSYGKIDWTGTNTTWDIAKTEEQYGTLSTLLTTADIAAKTDVSSLDCAEYVVLSHYAAKKDSSLLYANGKTSLDVYYTVSGNAESGKAYDMLSEIKTASETVTDSQLEKDVLKFVDCRKGESSATRDSKGVSLRLNYSEALAIQQIIYQENPENSNTSPTFTWTVRIKVDTPKTSDGTSKAHGAPRFRLAGATSATTDGLTAKIVGENANEVTLNTTTNFAYDCWVEFTVSSKLCSGYSGDYGNLMNYLTGSTSCIWGQNVFSDKVLNTATNTTHELNMYIDAFSFSVA